MRELSFRYCSLNVHNGVETGRRDDLISFCYMLTEFIRGRLPWSPFTEKQAVKKLKEDVSATELMHECPVEMGRILRYVNTLSYEEKPDYPKLRCLLERVMKQKGYQFSDPYDWMEGGRFSQFTCIAEPADAERRHSDKGAMEMDSNADADSQRTGEIRPETRGNTDADRAMPSTPKRY